MDLFHISFYRFVATPLHDVGACVEQLKALAQQHQLQGNVDVAREGVSGALAGSAAALDAFESALQQPHFWDGMLIGMPFKRTACTKKPFTLLRVAHCTEVLKLGIDEEQNARVDTTYAHGVSLDPDAWDALIASGEAVVIDNRNSFEYELGRFDTAIDPQVAHYRDFPRYIEAHLPQWQAQGKKVAMYCTGGIRCEKTAAWLANRGQTVYQLKGGIISYLAAKKAGASENRSGRWQGECFVFDNRLALDPMLDQSKKEIEDIYDARRDGQWRVARARRLAGEAQGVFEGRAKARIARTLEHTKTQNAHTALA